MDEKIVFTDEDGREIEMSVIAQTAAVGVEYLLVEGDLDGQGDMAYILKDTSSKDDLDAVYEMVQDDDELDYIGRIFSQMLEDIDFEG